ncbi:MAG: hypothetical protein QG597_68 [Actinomycetota bacterium]|nr:hypothetical protein [Actinomycetota bacterium]
MVALFIPVAYFTGIAADGPTAAWVGAGLAVLCVVAAGLVARPFGVALGWVVQVLVIATGVLVPMMVALGGIFAVLWWVAIRYGRRADAAADQRASVTPRPGAAAPGSQSG